MIGADFATGGVFPVDLFVFAEGFDFGGEGVGGGRGGAPVGGGSEEETALEIVVHGEKVLVSVVVEGDVVDAGDLEAFE